MAADQVSGVALASSRPLGLASWLGTRTSTLIAGDLVYQPDARESRACNATNAPPAP
jgi:hypothetical protein